MTFAMNRICQMGMLTVAVVLAGCASKNDVAANGPAELPARPLPPAGASANLQLPSKAADGQYVTINRGIETEEAVWHLRAALNVAALGCRGPEAGAVIANYNSFLKTHRKTLAAAYTDEQKRFHGNGGAEFDGHTTKLYNFFAQPPAKLRFCAAAAAIGKEANSVAPGDLKTFAANAVPKLEEPFLDFYRSYENYQQALVDWNAGRGRTLVAQAEPVKSKTPKIKAQKAEKAKTRVAKAEPAKAAAAVAVAASATQLTEPATPAKAASATVTAASWHIQLGAFKNGDSAREAWTKVHGKLGAFASLEPRYDPVPAKNLVRLQAGPLKDRSEANKLCNAAAAVGQGCIPVAPTT